MPITTKVILIEFDETEWRVANILPAMLAGRDLPLAAEATRELLRKIRDGEHLTSRQCEDLRVWLDTFTDHNERFVRTAKHMSACLYSIVR